MNQIQVFSQQARGCGNHPQMAGESGELWATDGNQISQTGIQVADFSPVTAIFHLISWFFMAFLSHRGLVSRGLRRKRGLFKSAVEMPKTSQGEKRESRLFLAKQAEPAPDLNAGCGIRRVQRARSSRAEHGMVRDSSPRLLLFQRTAGGGGGCRRKKRGEGANPTDTTR